MHSQKVFVTIIFNKPYGVLSQFTHEGSRSSLQDFGPFPRALYPVGRLDADTEGLLVLTNDNALKHQLTDPTFGHPKTYLVQVENIPSEDALEQLRTGVMIEKKKTKPSEVTLLTKEPALPLRPAPIRFRKNIPTAWLEITLREGRNRQIRKMTAAVGHPTLRLLRIRMGQLDLSELAPGKWRKLSSIERQRLLAVPREIRSGKANPRRAPFTSGVREVLRNPQRR